MGRSPPRPRRGCSRWAAAYWTAGRTSPRPRSARRASARGPPRRWRPGGRCHAWSAAAAGWRPPPRRCCAPPSSRPSRSAPTCCSSAPSSPRSAGTRPPPRTATGGCSSSRPVTRGRSRGSARCWSTRPTGRPAAELLELEAERAPRERGRRALRSSWGRCSRSGWVAPTPPRRRSVARCSSSRSSPTTLERLVGLQLRRGAWADAAPFLSRAASVLPAERAAALLRQAAQLARSGARRRGGARPPSPGARAGAGHRRRAGRARALALCRWLARRGAPAASPPWSPASIRAARRPARPRCCSPMPTCSPRRASSRRPRRRCAVWRPAPMRPRRPWSASPSCAPGPTRARPSSLLASTPAPPASLGGGGGVRC